MPVPWVLASNAPQDGAYALQGTPAVPVQDRTIGEFRNHDAGVNLILYSSYRYRNTQRIYAIIG